MNEATSATTRKHTGLLETAMHKLFMRNTQVVDVEDVGTAFRVVTLGGESLRNAGWTPGDKLQIQLGGWVQRTYTPIDWDAENGRTRILVHLHSGGPGAQWAHAVRTGSECIVFGPRKSIDLTRLKSSAILFGDETSFGLAAALIGAVSPTSAQMFFEVSSVVQAPSSGCARAQQGPSALPAVHFQNAALYVAGTAANFLKRRPSTSGTRIA